MKSIKGKHAKDLHVSKISFKIFIRLSATRKNREKTKQSKTGEMLYEIRIGQADKTKILRYKHKKAPFGRSLKVELDYPKGDIKFFGDIFAL